MVGPGDPVTFTATFPQPQSGDLVEVDELDASGKVIGKIADLFDDGSPAHSDAKSGDGLFNDAVVINFNSPGQRFFRAVRTDASGVKQQTAVTTISGLAQPSQQSVQAAIDDSNSLTQQAKAAKSNGQSGAQILGAIQQHLQAEAAVQQNTVQLTANNISWETTDGILSAVSLNTLNDPTAPTPALATSATTAASSSDCGCGAGTHTASTISPADQTNTCKQALQIGFGARGSFGGSDFRNLLTPSGYTVSIRPGNVSDYKNLSGFGAIGILQNGDALPGVGPVIQTFDQATYLTTALPDLISKRLVMDNGFFAITSRFIRTYAGALSGPIVFSDSDSGLADSKLGDGFVSQGAADFVGYSGIRNIAGPNGINGGQALFTALVASRPTIELLTLMACSPRRIPTVRSSRMTATPTRCCRSPVARSSRITICCCSTPGPKPRRTWIPERRSSDRRSASRPATTALT